MDDLVLLVWALVGLRLAILIVQVAVPRRRQAPFPVRQRVDPCLGSVIGLPPQPSPTAEDVLQARRLRGVMSREEYRAEMARLAELDDLSHPVSLP